MWSHSISDKLVEDEVAVKMMDNRASEEDRVKFLQEAAIMGQFNHPNIVRLLGIMTSPEPVCAIVEVYGIPRQVVSIKNVLTGPRDRLYCSFVELVH